MPIEPTSYIELSREAILHNHKYVQGLVGADTELAYVVKGQAYGHGYQEYIPELVKLGMKTFFVFSAYEAYALYPCLNAGTQIIVMGYTDDDEIEWLIANDIEFYIFNFSRLNQVVDVAKRLGKQAKVHIELETGMNRTGYETEEIPRLIKMLKVQSQWVAVAGLCTHLAGAESITNYYRIESQRKKYDQLREMFVEEKLPFGKEHVACSAGLIRYRSMIKDMVRIGILQYGFFPNRETLIHYLMDQNEEHYPLRRVLSWKTRVMDVKEVDSGEFIGYGTTFLTNIPTKIALIPVGYADGFSRSLSNQGRVLIRGNRFPVIGTVNMNMMTVDITESDIEISIGDEVVLIGHQGDLEISVASFSEFSDQVNYELLTRLPLSIPRKIIA